MSGQVAADLRAAADVLERHGWTQYRFYDRRTHARCAVGAINYVVKHSTLRAYDARCALARHVDALIPSQWNDAPERTAAEVIAALRAAADAAEAVTS